MRLSSAYPPAQSEQATLFPGGTCQAEGFVLVFTGHHIDVSYVSHCLAPDHHISYVLCAVPLLLCCVGAEQGTVNPVWQQSFYLYLRDPAKDFLQVSGWARPASHLLVMGRGFDVAC